MRRAKVFGEGTSLPRDRNTKARIMCRARAINARLRRGRQHIGPLTRACLEVLGALLYGHHNTTTGRCFPSHRTIAASAGVHRDTVNEAIKQLEHHQVLTWEHRLVRRMRHVVDAPTGRMVRAPRIDRTSNAYRFFDPVAPADFPAGTRCLKSLPVVPAKTEAPIDPTSPLERALASLGQAIAIKDHIDCNYGSP